MITSNSIAENNVNSRGDGFTLIELSIVLVIIGLIVGGIVVGQELITVAATRAQISQIEKYQTAVNTFRGKFGYLPGDIPEPGASQYGFHARGTLKGQGDGDGVIEGVNGGGVNGGYVIFDGETQAFWTDLSDAQLIDGGFTINNVTGGPPNVANAEVRNYIPPAKIGGGNYVYVWSGGYQDEALGSSDGINYFSVSEVIGEVVGMGGAPGEINTITAQQALAIDAKMDDGLPQSGNVMAMFVGDDGPWPAGGTIDPQGGSLNSGDFDQDTMGPITDQTVNPFYGDQYGAAQTDLCYTNGDTLAVEQYAISNTGPNCSLSFKFQ